MEVVQTPKNGTSVTAEFWISSKLCNSMMGSTGTFAYFQYLCSAKFQGKSADPVNKVS